MVVGSLQGRGLFATSDFKEGEVLFEEQPLVCAQFLWNAFYNYTACDHCLQPLETAEEACRRLTNSPNLELPHQECCETMKEKHTTCQHCQSADKSNFLQALSQFCKATVNQEQDIAHKLLGAQFQWFSTEGFQSLVALIGTNGQGIGTSSISRWVTRCEQLQLPDDEKVALDAFIDDLYENLNKGLYVREITCDFLKLSGHLRGLTGRVDCYRPPTLVFISWARYV
ncbi:hypothetical protein LSH36_833g00079 [Paralvinella palmiformis]|uniref:Uncharacterized protein n=1 Tax=Paralvinella palmiformis TaxID=53620 RepID=A0AAD9MRX9_9ANNE|nr:hypothetical protein LSH36_833g00079 [Paralvinella palmiformis]